MAAIERAEAFDDVTAEIGAKMAGADEEDEEEAAEEEALAEVEGEVEVRHPVDLSCAPCPHDGISQCTAEGSCVVSVDLQALC
mgnify:CR=1 FL=1|jgi:hypothetical protein